MAAQHTPQQAAFALHPLLCYSQAEILPRHNTPLLWDMREEPSIVARHIHCPDLLLTQHELSVHATIPPLPTLHVQCGVFPQEYGWEMTAFNPTGVTILDVLEAIRGCMEKAITHEEWDKLSPKQRHRINVVFDQRWRVAAAPTATRAQGILRQDCLLSHTFFGGLSVLLVAADACILTLKRPIP